MPNSLDIDTHGARARHRIQDSAARMCDAEFELAGVLARH
jgi:hypothetical protein